MSICIFPGTFNPIHQVHIKMAEFALDYYGFEKIIFIADKIECRTREEKYRKKIEKVLNKTNSLDEALLKSFKLTIKSLLKRKLPICFQTIDVYNDLIYKTAKTVKKY